MPRITFLLPDGGRRVVDAEPGWSLLEAARAGGIEVEGACGGSMACATCHMIVEAGWFPRLPPASAEEEDMLDFAEGLRPTSRLACQIRLTADLDGLEVEVPASSMLD